MRTRREDSDGDMQTVTLLRRRVLRLALCVVAVPTVGLGLVSAADAAGGSLSFTRTSVATLSPNDAVTLSYTATDSSGVSSVDFHYTSPLGADLTVSGAGGSGTASTTVTSSWAAGTYRLDYVDVNTGGGRSTYLADQNLAEFDAAAFTVTGTQSLVKPAIRGVLDRQGLPTSTWQPVVNGYVLRVDWSALQPTQGGDIAANNAIDQAIASLRTLNAQKRSASPHVFLKLRVLAGDSAPSWAKQLDGGPVTVADTGGGSVTVGKFWTDDFGAAYQDLMQKLAAKYDGVPEVRDIAVSRCTLSTAEPFQRKNSDATTRSNLLAAGFTTAADHLCHQQETDVHQGWASTTSSTAFTPYQQVDPKAIDESWTEQMIDYCRQVLTTRCVLESNGIQDPANPEGGSYPQMYAKINTVGPPIAYQTASPGNGLGSLCNTLTWAVSQGTGAVELPVGYDVDPLPTRFDRDQAFTVAGMSSYDKALEGASPADTDNPTAPANLGGTVASSTSATLTWNPASDGGYGVACYKVSRGSTELGTTMGTTFTYTGPGADTSTPYSVTAIDGATHSGPTASVVLADTEPPSAPSNVQATGISPTRIDLTWGAATDNFGVDHYTVYRDGVSVGTTPATQLSFSDTGLTPATSYSYVVKASDLSHEGPGASATGTTLADTSPPTAPTSLSARPALTSVALTWKPSTDNVGVAGYRVYRGNVLVGSPSGTSFTDSGLTPNTSYSYTVSAVDSVPNESGRSNTVNTRTLADKTPPSTPTNVRVTDTQTARVSIAWDASTDNLGVASYQVLRNGSVVATTPASQLTFTDTGLKPKTTYKYTVRAVDTSRNTSATSAAATTTTLADTVAPDPPVVTVTGTTASSVSLAWNKPADNVGTVSYKVLRNGVVVTSTTRTTFTNTGLHAGTTYQFSVRAFDAAGNWSESDPVSATPH